MNRRFQRIFAIVGLFFGIAASATTIITNVLKWNILQGLHLHLDAATAVLNIVILVVFLFLLKPTSMVLDSTAEKISFARLLNIEDPQYTTLLHNNDRANKLIEQLVKSLRWYMIVLIPFFIVNFIYDIWLKGRKPDDYLVIGANYLETITNTVSAAFLYLSFSVLYDTTLDQDNKTDRNYYSKTLWFLIIFFVSYSVLMFFPGGKDIHEIFKFISGFYNGLAMVLLFGRITGMNYFFKDKNLNTDRISNGLYVWGIYLVLPLYVLAQPLYPVLDLYIFPKETNEFFKSLVFLVCFVGKGCFLILIINYISQKWLHLYLHLVMANESIPESLDKIEKAGTGKPPGNQVLAPAVGVPAVIESSYLIEVAGEYEYVCSQYDGLHSHGGDCQITPVSNYQDVIEWKIRGIRRWISDSNGDKEMLTVPSPWQSEKGIIFKELTYLYNFNVSANLEVTSGVSQGHITISKGKTVEFNGHYFQRSGSGVVWGTETYKRKTR